MNNYFDFEENSTDLRTEILAGLTSFLATMYIIIVNPAILSSCGMSASGVVTATVLVSAFSSILMGIYAKNPIVIAPGMGINAFFTYTVVIGMKVPYEVALGAIFWSGLIFLLLSIFNVRTHIVTAIPKQIRYGAAAGIGLFISFIGLKNGGFIISNPATLLTRGEFNPTSVVFIIGFVVTAILLVRRVKAAFIIGIVLTTAIAALFQNIFDIDSLVPFNGIFSMPDFSLFWALDFKNSLSLSLWPVIFAFLFTDMFDSLSTFVGVAEAAELKCEKGEPRNIRESLIVDAVATTIAGIFGTSSGTSYIESAAGIEQGGRTGLTAVIAGLLFLPFLFMSPIISMVPSSATAPVLVLVGIFMMRPVMSIHWEILDNAIPAFLAMILIPLTFSISQGIIWGFLSWTIIKIAVGKFNEITPALIIIDILAIGALII